MPKSSEYSRNCHSNFQHSSLICKNFGLLQLYISLLNIFQTNLSIFFNHIKFLTLLNHHLMNFFHHICILFNLNHNRIQFFIRDVELRFSQLFYDDVSDCYLREIHMSLIDSLGILIVIVSSVIADIVFHLFAQGLLDLFAFLHNVFDVSSSFCILGTFIESHHGLQLVCQLLQLINEHHLHQGKLCPFKFFKLETHNLQLFIYLHNISLNKQYNVILLVCISVHVKEFNKSINNNYTCMIYQFSSGNIINI